jgi:signal transduction histidine kinase
MLRSDEMSRKKLAVGLHEGLAQTLSAVKVRIESSLDSIAASHANDASLASVVPALQHAIKDVQAIAAELRPSSLDDLGLLPTIDWFCREFEQQHPEITIDQEIALQEIETPAQLRIVVYRIVESVFRNIERYEHTDKISLGLRRSDGAIELEIDSTARDSAYVAAADGRSEFELQMRFAEARERVTLSGGTFSAVRNKAGGVTLRASWPA